VTAATETGPIGLTINSFASVSLDPPLILWSLDRASDRAEAFHIVDRFAINILSEEMQDLSARLAKKGAHAVPAEALDPGPGEVPVLHGALAQFICTVENRHDGGDHVIFVGRVVQFRHVNELNPLIYYRGKYRSLAEL
jgi:flavin reductase (DIM6/NTAB) family NADH-FMN oxidoreductase RutF